MSSLSSYCVRRHRTKFRRTRTIACGHFVCRTSVFYTRTIACAVACDRAIVCADPNIDTTTLIMITPYYCLDFV
uniref:Uncharacterized protein n=1 Tax=Acrobeloides nanus TaxID=290746 RepID=A0A914DIZ4_9BILA